MGAGDDFINIALLGERTATSLTDIAHIRSTGNIDSKITIENLLRDIISDNITASGDIQSDFFSAISALLTDSILERTANAGVTIDSVLLKDNGITCDNLSSRIITTSEGIVANKTAHVNGTRGGLYSALSALVPTIGNKKSIFGVVTVTVGVQTDVTALSYFERTSGTTIDLYGVIETFISGSLVSASVGTITLTSGSGSSIYYSVSV